jgi:hypothetical protein
MTDSHITREQRLTSLIAHLMLHRTDTHLRRYVMTVLLKEFGCTSLSWGLAAEDSPAFRREPSA